MLNSKTSVKLAALPFFALSLLAQPVTTPSSEPQERRLGHTVEGTRPFTQAVFHTLLAAGVPGGIISARSCKPEASVAFRATGEMTLGDALTHIATITGGGAHWTVADGVINVALQADRPRFLDVPIARLSFTDTTNLWLSLDHLIQSAEARKYLEDTKLNYRLPRSIWATDKPKTPPRPVEIRNMTISKVLNMLAADNGKAIWIYHENSCPNSPNTLDLRIVGE
ncbi:hypothetical protein [Paludibaculum fermentans]|uniref:Uncharacterized protein n=1 Tax=Paludibaculum fermentans TaxID=1473598 RepID=A0A7S7SKG7_PALFE|nr:hypothetical protein [Paludibaculum fermentans]QOY88314.1 hypothetical protein IRI77_37220 [Paludibaculum fermentans]